MTAWEARQRSRARFRVMRARKAPSRLGRWGGITFQLRSQVSDTHSSLSPMLSSTRRATPRQRPPYFFSDSSMARSSRSQ